MLRCGIRALYTLISDMILSIHSISCPPQNIYHFSCHSFFCVQFSLLYRHFVLSSNIFWPCLVCFVHQFSAVWQQMVIAWKAIIGHGTLAVAIDAPCKQKHGQRQHNTQPYIGSLSMCAFECDDKMRLWALMPIIVGIIKNNALAGNGQYSACCKYILCILLYLG